MNGPRSSHSHGPCGTFPCGNTAWDKEEETFLIRARRDNKNIKSASSRHPGSKKILFFGVPWLISAGQAKWTGKGNLFQNWYINHVDRGIWSKSWVEKQTDTPVWCGVNGDEVEPKKWQNLSRQVIWKHGNHISSVSWCGRVVARSWFYWLWQLGQIMK